MLKLNNVSAGYGEADIIKNISFEVKNSSNLSIIGPNGCGKSTLLKTVAKLLPISSGDIEIDGKSVRKMKHSEVYANIAMLGQISGAYFSYSVFDTVMMGRYLHMKGGLLGRPSKEDIEYVLHCLEIVNLPDDRDKDITKLSGGQLQRVFFARTLAQKPKIILLDEPTNHLDLKYQVELIEYLRNWSMPEGNIVIGVLHDINLAMRLSEDIMVMKDGRMLAYGKPGREITNKLLQDVYGIDVAGYMKDSLSKWNELSDF